MILQEIYKKDITRTVNPAVSATKMDAETKRVEIEEYVFTDEIINGLYKILNAIKNNEHFSHIGMWIDGYYGTGKSHFLKYFDYCITPDTQEQAMKRLIDAVADIDPFADTSHSIDCDVEQLREIERWLKNATIETCIFNLETSYDNSVDRKEGFIHIFWNEFNALRGFNKFNIALAQHLEKPLQQKGKFEEFKAAIADMGGNWEDANDAADLIDNETDAVLDIAKELAPSLAIDSIRERIIKRDTTISIDKFAGELSSYLKDKGDNYRLIMLADEVSQFINKQHDRFLNLQEIITKLSEQCQNKVWIACTAQQDLSEVMDDCQVAEERDREGKIKGRFEIKVSLKGTKTEAIVQKRILDKQDDLKPILGKLYEEKKSAIEAQYQLPTGYDTFTSKENFVDYYPFVPYQFDLIKQVFNSFLNLGYVAKEVKGNERSIIKVVHSTAKNTKEENVGRFIAFDELYNSMFEEGLQARGQKAIDNAMRVIRNYKDVKFGTRVVNVLFMICNISATDKLVFPASIANVTNLLLTDIDTPKLTLKSQVQEVIEYLCDNNIIRCEQGKQGAPDTYEFYSEEEMKVASLIQSQTIDNNTTAEMLKEIFFKYFNLKNKEQYRTRSFQVGSTIKLRNFLSNNPDIVVNFELDRNHPDVNALAIQNNPNQLVFYLAELYQNNKRLTNDFYWYCQVNQYMKTPATSADNTRTRDEFAKRAQEMLTQRIVPAFQKILDSCPIVSGQAVLDDPAITGAHGQDRYRRAVMKHFDNLYPKAVLVDAASIPTSTDVLKRKISSVIQPGEYEGMNADMTPAEREVEIYLCNQFAEVNVSDVTSKFAKAPFGWNDICTLYVINELVRRHKRDYSYSNNPNVETSVVASRLSSETNKFTLRQAAAISQDVVNNFTDAWRHIFGTTTVFASNDSTTIFRQCRDKESDRSLFTLKERYRKIGTDYSKYPFIKPIREAEELFEGWLDQRDPLTFFNIVIGKQNEAATLMDKCKEVVQFLHDQMPKYLDIIDFAESNKENFSSMPEESQSKGTRLLELKSEEWPIDKMPEFNRLRKEVAYILEQVKAVLREQIKAAYNEVFDLLEKSASDQNVPLSVISKRDITIQLKSNSNSISTLKLNLQTDDFYATEVAKILTYVKAHSKPTPPEGGDKPGKDNPQPPVKSPVTMTLNTRTVTPLKTASDVDAYVEKIRRQLMAKINNGESVMVIK